MYCIIGPCSGECTAQAREELKERERLRQVQAQNQIRKRCLACTNARYNIKTNKHIPHTCKE